MSMMEFVQSAASQLGADEGKVKSATGGLLGLVKDGLGAGDFAELAGKIPGADAMAQEGSGGGGGGGGLLGGLSGMASQMLGGEAGGALSVLKVFQDADLDADDAPKLVGMFVDFVKAKAGDGVVTKLLGKVPELAKLLG